jgi:hypothetical protein
MSKTIKVKMNLSIGLVGAEREDELEYDESDVPTDPEEREEWLSEEWKEWAGNYIDGSAMIAEED